MGIVDIPMRGWQKLTGLNGMAGVFLAPNMLIFTVFVLLPLVINFIYSTTSGSAIFLQNRTYVAPTSTASSSIAAAISIPRPAPPTPSGRRCATPLSSSSSR